MFSAFFKYSSKIDLAFILFDQLNHMNDCRGNFSPIFGLNSRFQMQIASKLGLHNKKIMHVKKCRQMIGSSYLILERLTIRISAKGVWLCRLDRIFDNRFGRQLQGFLKRLLLLYLHIFHEERSKKTMVIHKQSKSLPIIKGYVIRLY